MRNVLMYTMRLTVLICVLSAVAGLAPAQQLIRTIGLPDSLGNMHDPRSLLVDSTNNIIYAGMTEGVIAIDAVTNQRLGMAPTEDAAIVLCHNPVNRKLYAIGYDVAFISVIDEATMRRTRELFLANWPADICYDPVDNKVFCADNYANLVFVLDGATDSLLDTINVGGTAMKLIYEPLHNRLLCGIYGSAGAIAVIDCALDSVIGSVRAGQYLYGLSRNTVNGRIYASSWDDGLVTIFDPDSLKAIASIAVGTGASRMAFNPTANQLCCISYSGTSLIDGSGDSLLARLSLGTAEGVLGCNPSANTFFAALAYRDSAAVIDAATKRELARVWIPGRAMDFAYDPTDRKFYCAAGADRVLVFDGRTQELLATVQSAEYPTAMCFDSLDDKLYCADEQWAENASGLAVIHGAVSRYVERVPLFGTVGDICYASGNNQVYCGLPGGTVLPDSALAAVDCARDSVIARIELSGAPGKLLYDPARNKLFCLVTPRSAPGHQVAVVDCATNRQIGLIPVGPFIGTPVLNPDVGKVYIALQDPNVSRVAIIDAARDSIVAILVTGTATTGAIVYNPANRHVYAAADGGVCVIDGDSNRILGRVPLIGDVSLMYGAGPENKVYCAVGDEVVVIDGRADTAIRGIHIGTYANAMVYDPERRRLYCCSGSGDGEIPVIDCARDTVLKVLEGLADDHTMCWNPVDHLVYVSNYDYSSISVIDARAAAIASTPVRSLARPALSVYPNPCQGLLMLRFSGASPAPAANAFLHDVSGRKVMKLKPGANDVSRLAPGVYFVRSATTEASHFIHKVVMTR